MKNFDVKLYKGWPETSGDTLDEMIEKGLLTPLLPKASGLYDLCPGIYSGHITGEDVYPTLKVFSVKETMTNADERMLMDDSVVHLIKEGTHPAGYQPTVVVKDAPEFFKRTQKDELLCIWPDEILEIYGDKAVPKDHQCMTRQELKSVVEDISASLEHPYLKWYPLGNSEHYNLEIPMAVLSCCPLDGGSWQSDLETLRESGKLNIFYQAQIHGNEPAACDGALEVLKAFFEEKNLKNLLEDINLVVIPRANPEAAYLYRRMAYNNIDLNRDHMACDAYETRLLHRVFHILEPEIVLDGHEFTFYLAETEEGKAYVSRGCEVMTSPATSLNIDQSVRDCSYSLCETVFRELQEKGRKVFHFGTAEKASLGRGFYGLHQCLSFLVETRGIGGGRYGYEKRVAVQKDTMLAYIKNAASQSREIKETVIGARQNWKERELVFHHGSTETVYTPYSGINVQYYLDGSLREQKETSLLLQDLALRSRKPAKAYVLSADIENIDDIMKKVEALGCETEYRTPGTVLRVQQYQCSGLLEEDGHEKNVHADLLAEASVTFEKGVWIFPVKDYRGLLLAMLMEPDVTDTVGTKGSLFQQGLIDYDETTGLFPLYRTDQT